MVAVCVCVCFWLFACVCQKWLIDIEPRVLKGYKYFDIICIHCPSLLGKSDVIDSSEMFGHPSQRLHKYTV